MIGDLIVRDKKVFISYSWDSEDHKKWVKFLADRLEQFFEIKVSLDQYDLDSFTDKNFYMEKSVFETDIVFAVITEEYNNKANLRNGGVGIETTMAVSRHWEENQSDGNSNIIAILRSGEELPNYLKNKLFIDFKNDDQFETSFRKLLDHIKGYTKSIRPLKKHSILNLPSIQEFTRVEDFLKINSKNRKLVFNKSDTTDFSGVNRIKFELWETKSPSVQYYLFLFNNTSLEKTV